MLRAESAVVAECMRIDAGAKIGVLEVGIVGEGYFAPWVRKMALVVVVVVAGVQEGR